jgi:hypothetical protein
MLEAREQQSLVDRSATIAVPSGSNTATCANCGAPVHSRYCPDCGQETSQRITSIKTLAEEFSSEFLNFDSKLFVTLKVLALKPGYLTKEYIEGRRIRYLAPVRLFVLLSALMLLTSSISNDTGIDFITRMLLLEAPLLAIPLSLLYWSQKRYYIEHLIFMLHVQSYACLLGTCLYPVVGVLRVATSNFGKPLLYGVLWSLLAWMMFYMLLAMRRAYEEAWAISIVKFIVMAGCYVFPAAALILYMRSK